MKNSRLRSALIILLAVLTMLSSVGCADSYDGDGREDREERRTEEQSSAVTRPLGAGVSDILAGVLPSIGVKPEGTAPAVTSPAVTTPAETTPPVTQAPPVVEKPAIPTASTLTEVRDILWSAKERDELKVSFTYTGSDALTPQLVARISTAFYVYVNHRGNDYTVTMLEFPGDRMYDAYRTGDRSALSAEESALLDRAISIVVDLCSNCYTLYDIELAIYDYITSNVVYYSPTVDVNDPNDPPRHLTAVGALADGRANCQGYTDVFYLLASIAGIEVSRISAVDSEGLGHILNTVNINGTWYVVDVTFGDDEMPDYRLLNAGKDLCNEYTWTPEMEYHPIAQKSGSFYYYYKAPNRCFGSLDAMAEYVKGEYLRGTRTFRLMLSGQCADWSALSEPLSAKLNAVGATFSYNVWAFTTPKNTYYTVVFK